MSLTRRTLLAATAVSSLSLGLFGPTAPAAAETKISFYYPVAVGGPVTKIVDGMVAEFEKSHPGIKVEAVYSGSYQDTIAKILTAAKGGNAPNVAVALSTDMFTLIDEDAILPFDDVAGAEGPAWFKSFYPGFMANSQTGGKTWGIPFQRSTIVLYWNKKAFQEAGLDPEKAPANWAEMREMAAKLTKRDAAGNVTQWGVQIPSSGFPYWLFQGLTTPNGIELMNEAGNKVTFDAPEVVEALQYWIDLAQKDKVHPTGIVEWGTTPKDFLEGKVAMMWQTTGNLTNVRKNASFPFGVAMLPASKRRGSPTGGGNFYLFKGSSPEQQKAVVEFVKWMTTPERAAQWSIDTGYVAVSPAAFETPAMKTYLADFPQAAVARDQLSVAVAELSTHDNQRVAKALNDNLQAALTLAKPAAQAMKDAQAEADRILKAYR